METAKAIDFRTKRFVILGPQGSGKTVLAKHIARKFQSAWVVDPLDEYHDLPESHRLFYPARQSYPEGTKEIETLIRRKVLVQPQVASVDLFMIDEAAVFYPHGKTLPRHASWLNHTIRHTGMAWGLVSRRPVQLNVDLVELAHYVIMFRFTGRNDLAFADDLHKGLADIVQTLGPHEFVVRDAFGTVERYRPVSLSS